VALAVTTRFLIDMRLGPRTLETAAQMLATVAGCCGSAMPLLLVDNHRPYPAAILQVFGQVKHRRRRGGRGPLKHKGLKPPPGLRVGVVVKVRDAASNLVAVKTKALFGRLKDIRRTIRKFKAGKGINTAHVERNNGTTRGHVGRLARKTRDLSRRGTPLRAALALWRDVYNWVYANWALDGLTPAMASGLTPEIWTMQRYITYPVHADQLQHQIWAEDQENLLRSALTPKQRRKALPTS
jgi:IS1 family transposase